jgi:GH24 family phage-related lysozyme (muramidase)
MTPKSKRIASAAAIATALAIPAEGIRQYAYYDPPGILTVCYGSTHNVVAGKKYSMKECRARLDTEMNEAIDTVERCVPGLPENVLAAFGDSVYNLGPRIACDHKTSTAARLLSAGSIEAACNQLPRWNKARIAGVLVALPGLTTRRERARDVCLTPPAVTG